MTHGVRQIVQFNWPFYVASTMAGALTAAAVARADVSGSLRTALYAAVGVTLFWTLGSILGAWIVYDRSPLTHWEWIPRALGFQPRTWINLHTGLDESTLVLRRLFGTIGRVFDMFDPSEMTEASIRRARRLARKATPEAVDFRRLPVATGSTDATLLLFSAHELRTEAARCALFTELHRILAPHGRVIVAEHLRDWTNFAAFGPGFLHFHSRRTWKRCFSETGFAVHAEFAITPFVRIFVLRRAT